MRVGWARIVGPVLLFALAFAANVVWRVLAADLGFAPGDGGFDVVRELAQSSVWLTGAFLLIRIIDAVVWKGSVLHQNGVQATRLLMDLVNGVIVIAAVFAITAFVFKQPVTGLIATSSVAVAVVGFALKSLISDLFSGIAITLDRPFRMGDWVEISGGTIGKVTSISWRTTSLVPQNGVNILVPNGRLSEMILRVYGASEASWRDEIDIILPYDVTAHQAERILLSAAADVEEITGQKHPPDVRIVEFAESGTKWRLRYWVPDYPNRSRLRYAVQSNILRNLHFSGITVPAARIDAHVSPVDTAAAASGSPQAFLGRVSLFKMLATDEMGELASSGEFRLVLAGTMLVRNGDQGASLFVIKEGLFDVLIPDSHGTEKSVAHLKPGAFFGEMSLLTGAPRSATVRAVVDSMVIEITKEALQPILARRDAVVEGMSRALAERQLQNDRKLSEPESIAAKHEAHQTLASQLVDRIRAFFVLGGL